MMSGIRGKNTKPEVIVRKYLHGLGFRFRLHSKTLPGKPDIVLPRWRTVVQVHGCFWHQHEGCRFAYMPTSNRQFWRTKLRGNAKRDRRTEKSLRDLGWRVFVVWECEVGNDVNLRRLARNIQRGGK
jgi:DNA mismatch endonuclease (patch repair protein)